MFGKKYLLAFWMLCWGITAWGGDLLPISGSPRVAEARRVVFDATRESAEYQRVRIASYNIQDFFEGREGRRRTWENARRQGRLAAEILDEVDADLLLLQEIETPKMLALLNGKLTTPYPFGFITELQTAQGQAVRLNLAVLSRLPIHDAVQIDFSALDGPGRPTRGLLRLQVNLDDATELMVYNMHLKANWGNRRRNISQRYHAIYLLQEDLARQREHGFDGIVLLAGDFNFDPTRQEFRREAALSLLASYQDLWDAVPEEDRITIPTRQGSPSLVFPPVTFDRFYLDATGNPDWNASTPRVLSKGVHLEDNRMVAGEDATTASDHYPIYFDLIR